ncbi:MAG: WYL domain-containing protein [Chlorobi bacterium]|nr:WYL domain-containing protein [Chlorobiota bacterium]
MKFSNQVKRLSLIIEFLKRHTYVKKKEIIEFLEDKMEEEIWDATKERTGISERSVERDIETLRKNGFDIEYSKSRGGYILSSVSHEGIVFNRMLEVLHITRVASFGDLLQLETVNTGYEHLYGLLNAIKNKKKAEFLYQKFYENSPSVRKVIPIMVKEFKRRMYLLAADEKDKSIKVFAFDRISNISVLRESFDNYDNFDNYFDDYFGIVVRQDKEVETIRIKTYDTKTKYFQTLPLHHTQKMIEQGDDYAVFEYQMKITYDLIMELLSHSFEVEVLQPAELAEEIKWRLEATLKHYRR